MATLLALILMVDAGVGGTEVPAGAVELKVWRSLNEVPLAWRAHLPKDFDFEKEQLALASGPRGDSVVETPRSELWGTQLVVWPSPQLAEPRECPVCRGVYVREDQELAVRRAAKRVTMRAAPLYRLPRSTGAVFEVQVLAIQPQLCPPCLAP